MTNRIPKRGTRILFIVESGTDVRLVDGLAARSQLTVLARTIPGGVEISREPSGDVRVVPGPSGHARFAYLVDRYLAHHRRAFDGVVVQGYGPAALAANLRSRVRGLPTVMLVCSPVERYYACRREHPLPDKPYRRREDAALRVLARWNARLGHRYVVLSEHLARVVRGHGARRPVDVVPVYGVDTERFRPNETPKAELRRRLGLPPEAPVLFFSSRIAPEKDAETLLAAMRMLRNEGRDIWIQHLSGGHRAFVRAAEHAGVADRVTAGDAVHPVHELPDRYRASDLCVQASREEGLGFSPLEALACEIPVVASTVGGLRETIVEGETGWTYPPGNARALARAVTAALDDPAEARRRTRIGRRMVQTRYESWLVFDRFMEVIEGMVQRSDGDR